MHTALLWGISTPTRAWFSFCIMAAATGQLLSACGMTYRDSNGRERPFMASEYNQYAAEHEPKRTECFGKPFIAHYENPKGKICQDYSWPNMHAWPMNDGTVHIVYDSLHSYGDNSKTEWYIDLGESRRYRNARTTPLEPPPIEQYGISAQLAENSKSQPSTIVIPVTVVQSGPGGIPAVPVAELMAMRVAAERERVATSVALWRPRTVASTHAARMYHVSKFHKYRRRS